MPATRTMAQKKVHTKKKKTQASRSPAPKRRLIQPDDLLRFIFVGDPQMSPDGANILFVRKHIDENKYKTNLWVAPTGSGEARQFTSGDNDQAGRWSHDGSRIAFIRTDREAGRSQIFLMDSTGGEARPLTNFPEGAIGAVRWSPDGRFIAVSFRATEPAFTKEAAKKREESGESAPPRIVEDCWYRLDGDGYFGAARHVLQLIDVANGEARIIFDKDALGHFSFDFSPDSKTIAVSANRTKNALLKPWNDELFLVDVSTGRRREIPKLPRGPKANLQWSPDGKWLAYAGRIGDDSQYSTENLELWICDPKSGRTKCLTGEEDYCLMAITLSDTADAEFGPTFCWHPDSQRIFMRIGWQGEGRIASVGIDAGPITFHTKGAQEHALGTFDREGKKLGLIAGDFLTLPEVAVGTFEDESLKVQTLTRFNKKLLAELDLAKPTSHWITSEDGARVQVWVLRPPQAKRAKVPAILEIHGGPHAQYGVPFFHEFQVLAAAGYAVFFSNPRGSKGYGRDFCHAIRGTWGDRDWVDVQAVIQFIKSIDWVDSKRMGVMGGSYGAYMTNWVIGHTCEFAAAITDRCVSNLLSMWGNSDFPFAPDRYWKGNAWDQIDDLWRASPMRMLGNARTPTLIIHSEGDLRCNIEQAEQVFTVLKTHNVPVRFVRYPTSTSHGLSRMGPPDLRLHRLREILDWWRRWLS